MALTISNFSSFDDVVKQSNRLYLNFTHVRTTSDLSVIVTVSGSVSSR